MSNEDRESFAARIARRHVQPARRNIPPSDEITPTQALPRDQAPTLPISQSSRERIEKLVGDRSIPDYIWEHLASIRASALQRQAAAEARQATGANTRDAEAERKAEPETRKTLQKASKLGIELHDALASANEYARDALTHQRWPYQRFLVRTGRGETLEFDELTLINVLKDALFHLSYHAAEAIRRGEQTGIATSHERRSGIENRSTSVEYLLQVWDLIDGPGGRWGTEFLDFADELLGGNNQRPRDIALRRLREREGGLPGLADFDETNAFTGLSQKSPERRDS